MGALALDVLRVDPVGDPATDGATACVLLRPQVVTETRTVGGHALVMLRRVSGALPRCAPSARPNFFSPRRFGNVGSDPR